MATLYTDITSRENTGTTFANRIDDARRVERSAQSTDAVYVIAGTEAVNDLIFIARLPLNAIEYPENSFIYAETSPGTTFTLDIGDLVVANRYGAGVALGGQTGIVQCTAGTKNLAGITTRLEVAEATATAANTRELYAKVTAVAGLSAGARLHFRLAYKTQ